MRPTAAGLRDASARIQHDWNDLPLRTRLTTAAALAATLTTIAVVAVAYVAVRHELRAQIDRQLHRQGGEVVLTQAVDPVGFPHPVVHTGVGDIGGFFQVVAANGDTRGHRLPVSDTDLRIARDHRGTALRDAEFHDRHVRIYTEPVPGLAGFAVQIALPLTAVDHQLNVLAGAFAVLALCGLALTIVASWLAVRRVTRPVRTLTETAEQIAATRDLTVRIEAESADELGRLATSFNTMLDALERAVNAQRQLVTDASHELRTPLASLRTNVEVLNDVERLSVEQRKAVLAGIVTQLDELTGLVADVVELARGESPPSDHDDVAVDELVGRAVDRARRHWPATTFDVQTEPLVVRGVVHRLDRAVANLLDNAAKFSPPGAPVEVRLAADGTLTVADRGPGIPQDALPHVFKRFFRADEARALPGSGLGLAIAQQVAEGHGGRVELANRPGGGATATLVLPPAGDAGPRPASGTHPTAGQSPAQAAAPGATGPSPENAPVPVEESLFR